MTTDPSALPQHLGRPVPWITRWTNEVSYDKLNLSMLVATGQLEVNYPDGNENRDAHGWLWKREAITRGGKPQFGDVNTYRQRAAMNRCLCQVCGKKIDERPIRWLMPKEQYEKYSLDEDTGDVFTISAPTCSECIPLARELCPHLSRGGSVIMRVLDYEIWGVYGEAIVSEGEKIRDMRGVMVGYEDPWINPSAVVAFQQVARITKYVLEKEPDND